MSGVPAIRRANAPARCDGRYVLYSMIANRQLFTLHEFRKYGAESLRHEICSEISTRCVYRRKIGVKSKQSYVDNRMWNRSCPLCFVRLPRATILARSDNLICPSCRSILEISRPSRVFGALGGLIAGYFGGEIATIAAPRAAWFLAVVAAVLAYGIVSALVLYAVADLVVQRKPLGTAFPHALE